MAIFPPFLSRLLLMYSLQTVSAPLSTSTDMGSERIPFTTTSMTDTRPFILRTECGVDRGSGLLMSIIAMVAVGLYHGCPSRVTQAREIGSVAVVIERHIQACFEMIARGHSS